MRASLWTVRIVYLFLLVFDVIIIDVKMETQTKLVSDDNDRDEPVSNCTKNLISRGTYGLWTICDDVSSFHTGEAQLEGEMKLRVSQVNGGFTFPPNGNLRLVALDIQQTNLTHFTNHTQDLSTLEELVLNGNPDFDASSLLLLRNLTSLVTLELAGTKLATLNRRLRQVLKKMPSLQYLDLSSTNLHYLDINAFQNNPKLRELNIAGNEFINLTLDEGLIQQLENLNISSCSMEELHIKGRTKDVVLTHLHFVDLSHNYLTSLSASFMNIISYNQVSLDISDNLLDKSCSLCSYYRIWNYAVEHSDKIHGVNHNCFRPKEALKMCGWEECPPTCTCNPDTKTVNCSSTELKTIPYLGPSDAEILLVENNSLLNMSGIESSVWCQLKIVNADHNRIASIMPSDIVGQCACFDNDSSYEDNNCLPQSLKKLSLNHNKIKNLSRSDCHLLYPLQELHLSDNKVEHLGGHVCRSLKFLESLHLNNNNYSNLEEEDVAPYPNLRELNLSFNQLVILPERIIELIPKLTILDVSHNKLRKFTRKTSTPDTPYMADYLKVLDLSNNNLKQIDSVLSLRHIPILENLSIYNNPWECTCESTYIIHDCIFKSCWKNTAFMNATEILKCQKPASMKDEFIRTALRLQNCTSKSQREIFQVMIAILIIIMLVGIIVKATYRKIPPTIYDMLGLSPPVDDKTFRRKYSVFIAHSDDDYTMVKTDLVDPLEERSYSVAWNENAFLPGDNTHDSIEKAVVSSRRMLVIASNNFLKHLHGKRIIQRGLVEERNIPGFKVIALVMDDLPKVLYNDLSNIVTKRINVLRRNRNYLKKICDILPSPLPAQTIITVTETNLWEFLRQQMEIAQKRMMQRTHLQEVFPSYGLDSVGSSFRTFNTTHSNHDELVQVKNFTRGIKVRCTTRF